MLRISFYQNTSSCDGDFGFSTFQQSIYNPVRTVGLCFRRKVNKVEKRREMTELCAVGERQSANEDAIPVDTAQENVNQEGQFFLINVFT